MEVACTWSRISPLTAGGFGFKVELQDPGAWFQRSFRVWGYVGSRFLEPLGPTVTRTSLPIIRSGSVLWLCGSPALDGPSVSQEKENSQPVFFVLFDFLKRLVGWPGCRMGWMSLRGSTSRLEWWHCALRRLPSDHRRRGTLRESGALFSSGRWCG